MPPFKKNTQKHKNMSLSLPTDNVFSHPDYTVGTGISPVQPLTPRVMDYHHR